MLQQQLVESSAGSFVRPWDLIGKATAAGVAAHAAARAAADAASRELDHRLGEDDDEGEVYFVSFCHAI